ncbi:MAG: ABC transporter permease [Acidimicrobiales bacterium]
MAEAVAQLRIWRHLVGAKVRSGWQYRGSFWLFLLSQTVVMFLDFGVIVAIFTKVDSLGGWSAQEVALLYGISGVAFGTADTLVSAVENASTHIKAGTFDLFLLRPVSPLLHLTASEFELRRIGRVIQPAIVLVVALMVVDTEWTVARVALLPVTVAAGTVIFGAVWVATSAMAFWTVESQEMGNAFTYGGNLATQYPLDVLGDWLRHLFTFVFPLAFVAYLPASEILGKPTPLDLPDWTVWASPAVALLAGVAALAIWRTALGHHQSTGS